MVPPTAGAIHRVAIGRHALWPCEASVTSMRATSVASAVRRTAGLDALVVSRADRAAEDLDLADCPVVPHLSELDAEGTVEAETRGGEK